ncbi:MAG: pyridoxal phosphate-dependent aminotransferase [Lewinella sp.]|nr:pyridoxal phosphate-dependent aminotransferase [Lewinella sp.]
MLKIQSGVAALRPSDTLTINQLSHQLQSEGKTIYKFGFGQSPFPVPPVVQEALRKNAHQKDYLPVQGLGMLREKIAAHTNQLLENTNYDADNVFIGPGSKELIYLVQLAIDAPLLLPSPSWVSYAPQAQIVGKKAHWIPTQLNHWKLKAAVLKNYLERHRIQDGVLILNYPSVLFRSTFSTTELKAIAEVCRQFGLIVISDEIYGLLNFGGEYHSIANFYPEGTLITTGLSKWAGAGGWRMGAMIIPNELKSLYQTMRVLASETFSAVSAPIQFAAVTAYEGDSSLEDYKNASRCILQKTANFCYQKLITGGVEIQTADGGFYLFPNFTRLVELTNSVRFCQQLLNETGVALLPGTSFGRPANELTARLCFVDFDGEVALQHFYKHGQIEEEDLPVLFPKLVEGMSQLMGKIGKKVEV